MGVKYLWGVIDPICREKPVSELFGKRLAIDTSCWVVSDHQILPSHIAKPHLRNLFFRTASLIDNGIEPVYVLEGKAPELKAQVMAKRKEARFGPSEAITTDNSRSRYKFIQKECTQLLNCLGVSTVESKGEAEAACAALNKQGLVEGCVTIDGDTFLYGARTVYRNLSTDTSHFVCQEYSMDLVESRLNLSRDKLIIMAILFGCDYLPDGVPGVGKDTAMRVLSSWQNGSAIDRFNSWKESEQDAVPPRPAHCSNCKHPGGLRSHAKSGCPMCHLSSGCRQSDSPCQCTWHLNEILYEESTIRSKVSRLTDLEAEKIFDEFLNGSNQDRIGLSIRPWRMPDVREFVAIATKKLKWEASYAVEKILPMLSRWVVIHAQDHQSLITPVRLFKKRVKRGCPLYEVEWKFEEEIADFPAVFQTLEPQFLVERGFAHLLPQPVPKPIKKTRKTKAKPAEKTAKTKPVEKTAKIKPAAAKEKDILSMFQKMKLDSKIDGDPTPRPVSPLFQADTTLDLTGGTDDSDISFIVNVICQKKKKTVSKSFSSNEVPSGKIQLNKSVLQEENSDAEDIEDSQLKSNEITTKKLPGIVSMVAPSQRLCPVGNFSLNFTLDKLELSEHSFRTSTTTNNVEEITSTPLKKSYFRADDSFSTPQPLAERFSRLQL